MIKSTIILLASTVISTTAFAADFNSPAAAVDTFSWTGGYIGINGGYAGGKVKLQDTEVEADEDSGSFKLNSSGFIGGVQAGYNWQFNKTVIGVETDFQASGVNADFDISDETRLQNKVQWFGTLRARVGYLPTERFMVYATGGAAYGKVKTSVSYAGFEEENTSASKTKWGYTVGAGAEYALANNWTLKTEYLYTDLGKAKLSFIDDGEKFTLKNKTNFHAVRVGLNYKF